jgi:hypothetical protein
MLKKGRHLLIEISLWRQCRNDDGRRRRQPKGGTMPLPKHERTTYGNFRQANGNERAKNLAKDYPEFNRVNPNTKLGTLRDVSGETSINGVRRWLRENR